MADYLLLHDFLRNGFNVFEDQLFTSPAFVPLKSGKFIILNNSQLNVQIAENF